MTQIVASDKVERVSVENKLGEKEEKRYENTGRNIIRKSKKW